MPRREDDYWANQKEGLRYCSQHKRYYKEEYGCQLCLLEKSDKNRKIQDSPNSLDICPECNRPSLFWNNSTHLYECLNTKCKRYFNKDRQPYIEFELQTDESIPQASSNSQHASSGIKADDVPETFELSNTNERHTVKSESTTHHTAHIDHGGSSNRRSTGKGFAIPPIGKWLIALLFTFSISLVGLGISLLISNFIPLWISFLFSIVYSIEKWLYYRTKKHKSVGKLYRIFLNLSIISLLCLMAWSGIELFSNQLTHSPITGSLIFVAELVVFFWMWRVVAKNSWRWPSLKLTTFSLICLFLIFVFAGVEPLSSYKNSLTMKWATVQDFLSSKWTTYQAEQEEKAKIVIQEQERVDEQKQQLPENPTTSPPSLVVQTTSFEEMFNDYRQAHGLSALIFTDDLNRMAELRLAEIQINYNHSSAGNYNRHLAENINMISFGPLSDGDAFSSWKSSPGHNANMLDPNYRYTGYANGGGYAIQLFTEYITVDGKPQLPPGWYWLD